MITAVDTSVLIDILGANATFGPRSSSALRSALSEGGVVVCETVWVETTAHFASAHDAAVAMGRLRVEYSPLDRNSASSAGDIWRAYRLGGGTRERVAPDFLVGAHALHQADRLLTRDRGFYRRYFCDLPILDPAPEA